MATPLSTYREPVRVLIGDNDPDIQLLEDAQLYAAMRTVLDLGKVTGIETSGYAVDTPRTGVTPDLTAVADPKGFAQLVYHTARLFLMNRTPISWRTRAFSETIGNNYEAVWNVIEDLYSLENGDGCVSSDYPT